MYSALAGAASLAAVTTWRPRAGLALLCVALPWFAHHPSSSRNVVLFWSTFAFLVVYVVRTYLQPQQSHRATPPSQLMRAVAAWAAAAVISLAALPWSRMLDVAEQYRRASPGRGLWDVAAAWATIGEAYPHFSVVSAVLTVQAAVLAWVVWRETRKDHDAGVFLASSLTVGLTVVLGIGMIEAAGLIDMRLLRGAEMVHTAPGSIQSVTGNRGWFAQYVVYTLPYALVLNLLPRARWARVALWTVVLTAVACLTFAFQRGGWASGLAVVASVLVCAREAPLRTPSQARHAAMRALSIVGLVVVAAVCLVLVLRALVPPAYDQDGQPHVLGKKLAAGSYLSRLQGVDVLGGRETYWPVTWGLLSLNPIVGGGVESFAYQYQTEVVAPAGRLHGRYAAVPMPTSAHSIYLQSAVGTGLLGLAALLSLFLLGSRAMWRVIGRQSASDRQRLLSLAAGTSLLGLAVYGFVQEVTYVHSLRLLLCCTIGLLAGLESETAPATL